MSAQIETFQTSQEVNTAIQCGDVATLLTVFAQTADIVEVY